MIRTRAVKKWTLRLLVVVLIASAASLLWVDHQLRRFSGAHAEVVDHTAFRASPGLTAITNVHVLAPDGSRMIAGRTVVFDGTRIISVDDGLDVPADARVVDGTGRYLIPGLVDSHVHLRQSQNDLLLYVANGVTYIREMSGNADHLDWRRQIEEGRIGPRIFMASEKLGKWGFFNGHFRRWTRNRINVGADGNAEALIQSMADDGFDAVKLGGSIDAGLYREINRAAAKAGMPVVGHLPAFVSLDDVWGSGQTEIAHIEEFAGHLDRDFGYFNSRNADEYLAYVTEKSTEVAGKLVEHDIAVTSTIWLMETIPRQTFELDAVLDEIELAHVNPGLLEGTPLSKGWLPGNNVYEPDPQADAGDRAAARAYWATYAKAHHILVKAMVDKGVRLMAGTDADNAVVVPGFSMHDELESLAAAGMSPSQSLLSATAVPGDWMGTMTGRIQPGYLADMVLLRKNPLDEIGNTRTIEAVVVKGSLIERAQLDAMLAAVKDANDRSRTVDSEFLR